MYCGAVLRGSEEDSKVAFIDEDGNCSTFSSKGNEKIVELVEEKRPDVVVLNAPPERGGSGFTEQKERNTEESGRERPPNERVQEGEIGEEEEESKDLVEEGYSFLPEEMRDREVLEQAEHLAQRVRASGAGSEIVESNPRIVAEELEVQGDTRLEAYGVDTSDIGNVWEFDAALLALVARFHAEERTRTNQLVLPDTEEV